MKCQCECDCPNFATVTSEGLDVCEECEFHAYDDFGNFIGCGRTGLGKTCPDCNQEIQWGVLRTGNPGSGMWREGSCQCKGVWSETEVGSEWRVGKSDSSDSDSENED